MTFPHGLSADISCNENRNVRNTAPPIPSNEVDLSPVRLTKQTRDSAVAQTTVQVRRGAIRLSFLDPRPSIEGRNGIRMTGGAAELDPRKEFDVTVANFSRMDRTLPRHTVIENAKQNPIAIITLFRET